MSNSYLQPAPLLLDLTTPSDAVRIRDVRHAVESFAKVAGLSEAASDSLGLCLNEALANVIRHAYEGAPDKPIRVIAEAPAPSTVRVSVRDWGNGVDPSQMPAKPRDPLEPGGIGLVCLKELMDEVLFTPQPDGMLLTLTKRGGPADGQRS